MGYDITNFSGWLAMMKTKQIEGVFGIVFQIHASMITHKITGTIQCRA